MAKSSRENEIKLAFPSPASATHALIQAGASPLRERVFEDNVAFDRPGRPLTQAGQLLRLRRSGDVSILTFKSKVEGEHRHKVMLEHETVVADHAAMLRILAGLGYVPVYRYQKYRSSFRLGGVEAVVDETPIGTFVELEGEAEAVDLAAASLGASPGDYIRATYRELHERHAAASGTPAGDLLMETDSGSGVNR
jgi:adenylate cyclase, class 2